MCQQSNTNTAVITQIVTANNLEGELIDWQVAATVR